MFLGFSFQRYYRLFTAFPQCTVLYPGLLLLLCLFLVDSLAEGQKNVLTSYQGDSTLAATYFGSGLNADALSNSEIGSASQNTCSYGFRRTHTGALASVRIYVVWSANHPGYSGGTWGALLVQLQTDDGSDNHHPSGQTLASVLHTDPMHKGSFPVLTFSFPARIQQGEIYHLVITNPDPDPVTNYVWK